jgi:hypothetical protein
MQIKEEIKAEDLKAKRKNIYQNINPESVYKPLIEYKPLELKNRPEPSDVFYDTVDDRAPPIPPPPIPAINDTDQAVKRIKTSHKSATLKSAAEKEALELQVRLKPTNPSSRTGNTKWETLPRT